MTTTRCSVDGEFRLALAICAVALLAFLVGCGREEPSGAGEIDILCGGSFQPPVEKLARTFEGETGIKATLVFGQSEDHLPHVKMPIIK